MTSRPNELAQLRDVHPNRRGCRLREATCSRLVDQVITRDGLLACRSRRPRSARCFASSELEDPAIGLDLERAEDAVFHRLSTLL